MKSLQSKVSLHQSEAGFTLIEMLVVVTIVGILIGFGAPALNTAKEDAQGAKRDQIATVIEGAKARTILIGGTSTITAGGAAAWSEFSKYVNINGGIPARADLVNSSANKAGSNLESWGTYPATDGSVTKMTWGTGTAVSN
jgi:prepilin-type N-terminal cleavage/methylation domain-containing protein